MKLRNLYFERFQLKKNIRTMIKKLLKGDKYTIVKYNLDNIDHMIGKFLSSNLLYALDSVVIWNDLFFSCNMIQYFPIAFEYLVRKIIDTSSYKVII